MSAFCVSLCLLEVPRPHCVKTTIKTIYKIPENSIWEGRESALLLFASHEEFALKSKILVC